MARYLSDLDDVYFNLFSVLKVHEKNKDFGIEEIKSIVTEFDKFIANEIFPTREEGDLIGVKMEGGKVIAPKSFLKAKNNYHANGWFALGVKESIGGLPVPEAVYMACQSLFVGANVAFTMYPGLTKAALNAIRVLGTPEQKDRFIPKIMEGVWGGTMCLTEPGAGSDVGATKTTAKPLGDGTFEIKGVKIFISSGESDLYENNIHLVLARTPNAPAGVKGLSLFIVPRFKVNPDGTLGGSNDVLCTKIEHKMGIHGSATCELTFGTQTGCIGVLLGKEFQGIANMFLMMNEARLLCGVQGESQANLATLNSIQYAKEREQFGEPIIDHPDVRRMLLKMRAMSRGMRGLILYTANLFDNEHENSAEIAFLTPICKSYCTDFGFNVCVDAMQIHGGYGYCVDYGMEQFVRDAKIATIYEGTNGIQAIDFVMRKILRDQGKTLMKVMQKIMESLSKELPEGVSDEVEMIKISAKNCQEIMDYFKELIKQGNQNKILEHCTDFLNFFGNLTLAWILLTHAKESAKLIQNDPNGFYRSKVSDFKIFCSQYLGNNKAIYHSILNSKLELSKIEI
jgi:alkylation response protein AidB-like acyl-CoA dehydrogenase